MKLRAKVESAACSLSKMADLHIIIAESDRIATFRTPGTFTSS
jgi:hypothetical protein